MDIVILNIIFTTILNYFKDMTKYITWDFYINTILLKLVFLKATPPS